MRHIQSIDLCADRCASLLFGALDLAGLASVVHGLAGMGFEDAVVAAVLASFDFAHGETHERLGMSREWLNQSKGRMW